MHTAGGMPYPNLLNFLQARAPPPQPPPRGIGASLLMALPPSPPSSPRPAAPSSSTKRKSMGPIDDDGKTGGGGSSTSNCNCTGRAANKKLKMSREVSRLYKAGALSEEMKTEMKSWLVDHAMMEAGAALDMAVRASRAIIRVLLLQQQVRTEKKPVFLHPYVSVDGAYYFCMSFYPFLPANSIYWIVEQKKEQKQRKQTPLHSQEDGQNSVD